MPCLNLDSFSFALPCKVHFVPGNHEHALKEISSDKISDMLVLIDTNVVYSETVKPFIQSADRLLGIRQILEYDGGEPTYAELEEIRKSLANISFGAVLAIGGGSTMDVGKALAVLHTNEGPAISYRGFDKPTKPALPIITAPTVAGTGSEVTPNASFVDDVKMAKMGINGECVRPRHAIIDSAFSFSCPEKPSLSAGLDSMVHSTEAYVARKSNPLAKFFALKGFALAFENLGRVITNPQDLEARSSLSLASLLSAFAMMHSGTGPAAALSYPLGVRHSVAHGIAGSFFLPLIATMTQEAGCPLHDELMDFDKSRRNYPDALLALWQELGVPSTLGDLGISLDDHDLIIADTLDLSAALEQHPTPFGSDQLNEVLSRLQD
jgi:alcohol dehydrogenase class IV